MPHNKGKIIMMQWNSDLYRKVRRIITSLLRIGFAFGTIFSCVYFFGIAAYGAAEGMIVPATAFLDCLYGAVFVPIIIMCWGLAHTRMGALSGTLAPVYWWFIVSSGIFNDASLIDHGFVTAVVVMGLPLLFLCATALLGLVAFILDCVELGVNHRSFWLGPWFHGLFSNGRGNLIYSRGFSAVQKRTIWKTIIATGIVAVFVITGLGSYLGAYASFTYPVTITPANYNITYNFWATPDINGTYNYTTELWAAQYHIGPDYYPNTSLDQFDKYHVNLDLTFMTVDNTTLPMLMQWEHRCPHITYRIVLAPTDNNLSTLESQVETATDLLMTWEAAGNISHWKGFAFDIEGFSFEWWSGFKSYADASAMWNRIFDFIDQKSAVRGKTIDMESISGLNWADASTFPGSGIQGYIGLNAYSPNRFTDYAPML
jgi:hypothetical protein